MGARDISLVIGKNAIRVPEDHVMLVSSRLKTASIINIDDFRTNSETLKNELRKFKNAKIGPEDIRVYSFTSAKSFREISECLYHYRITNISNTESAFEGLLSFPELRIIKSEKKNVMILEDSPAIARILIRCFENTGRFENIFHAGTLAEARKIIATKKVDLISLDLILPDGIGIKLLDEFPKFARSTILITDCSKEQSPYVLECLDKGALAYFKKPSFDQLQELQNSITEIVEQLSFDTKTAKPTGRKKIDFNWQGKKVILIGSSTGGTEVVKQIIHELPKDCPPIVVVQHMPESFTGPYAERLTQQTSKKTFEVKSMMELKNGHVYLAAGGVHAVLVKEGRKIFVKPQRSPEVNRFCPSVSVLFKSAYDCKLAEHSIAIMLTGMGYDGAREMKLLRDNGTLTLGQSRETCVVYGMPRAAFEAGAVMHECSPDEMISLFKK